MKRIDKISVSRRRIYEKRKKPRYINREFRIGSRQEKLYYWRWEIAEGHRKGGDRDRGKSNMFMIIFLNHLHHGNMSIVNLKKTVLA